MTIFCDWPRGLVCNACRRRIALPKTAITTIEHDAAMRAAGWVEYAPRFVIQLVGSRHAPTLHVCGRCVVELDGRGERLQAESIEKSIAGNASPAERLQRAGRRLDLELGLVKSTRGRRAL